MTDVLDDDAVAAGLAEAPGWSGDPSGLRATFTSDDFIGAMAVVTQVAMEAEKAFHHPDIHVSWNTVTLELSSHDAGGVTQQCLDLAAAISRRVHTT